MTAVAAPTRVCSSDGRECFDLEALSCYLLCTLGMDFTGDTVTVTDLATAESATGTMPACTAGCSGQTPVAGVFSVPPGGSASITGNNGSGDADFNTLYALVTNPTTGRSSATQLTSNSSSPSACGGGSTGTVTFGPYPGGADIVLVANDVGPCNGGCNLWIYSWDSSHTTVVDSSGNVVTTGVSGPGSWSVGMNDGGVCGDPPGQGSGPAPYSVDNPGSTGQPPPYFDDGNASIFFSISITAPPI